MMIGPSKTPPAVKAIIWITAVISVFSPIITVLMARSSGGLGPGAYLALSYYGIMKGWLWQPITYFFVHSIGIGISIFFLISLFFHMFLLWFAGSEVNFRYGTKAFLFFYLSSGLVAGLITGLALYLFSANQILVGSGPPVFALLTIWAMIYPNMQLSFLFLIRMKAKTLVLVVLAFGLVLNLANGQWVPFLGDLLGVAWALLIGTTIWRLSFPWKPQR